MLYLLLLWLLLLTVSKIWVLTTYLMNWNASSETDKLCKFDLANVICKRHNGRLAAQIQIETFTLDKDNLCNCRKTVFLRVYIHNM